MALFRLKDVICLTIPLMVALASGDAAVASPAQSGQTVYVDGLDTPVELPVVFPPVKKIAPKLEPTEQELRTRAEAGDVEAMEAYADSLPQPRDFPWYLKAAEGGSPRAMIIVANRARLGETGSGVDLTLSKKWLNKALQTGQQALIRKDVKVLLELLDGDFDDNGLQGNSDLDAPTRTQYALAIGRAGGFEIDIDSSPLGIRFFYLGLTFFPDTPEKIQLLRKCSDHGHLWCTEALADAYLSGSYGLVLDHALGLKLLTKAAQAGYKYIGFSNSLSQAENIELCSTAIEHDALGCTRSLADAYRDGDGVPKSAPIAAALLQTVIQRSDLVAVNGNEKASLIWDLASMYVDGKSFPISDQLFLRVLNSSSSLDKLIRTQVMELLLIGSGGLLRDDTLNITEATRLLLLKSVVEKNPPVGDAVRTDDQYQCALRLGDNYSSGQKMKQSYTNAMTWYQKAEQIATGPADDNFTYDGAAAIKIGKLYENGLGVPKDSSVAMSWYQKAADNMISHSAPPFTLMQLLNSVQLPKESVDRVISFIRSLAEADNDEAEYYLGEMNYEGKYMPQSYGEAAGWFERCDIHSSGAIGSWMNCARALGKMYLHGQGVISDPAKAATYYQQLFDAGTDVPQDEDILLPMYCGGEGISLNKLKAFAVFKKTADYNDVFGELGVGAMYQMGWGVEQDLAEAFNWYRKTTSNKNYSSTQAKADLTRIFRDCKGTPDNFNAAVSLYEKASGGQH